MYVELNKLWFDPNGKRWRPGRHEVLDSLRDALPHNTKVLDERGKVIEVISPRDAAPVTPSGEKTQLPPGAVETKVVEKEPETPVTKDDSKKEDPKTETAPGTGKSGLKL